MSTSVILALSIGIPVLLITICCLTCSISNNKRRKTRILKLESTSRIAHTEKGPVEYSIKGNAPYVLGINGTPSLHDGVMGMFEDWSVNGFGVISPARPGYGRTPLRE